MSILLKLSIDEYDRMIARGAFDGLDKRIELIYGELREMNPAGPVHEDIISYLTRWSVESTSDRQVSVRVQCGLGIPELESVPEPDIAWIRHGRYRQRRPEPADVLLLIEVADSSLTYDLHEKLQMYSIAGVKEYWVVNVPAECVEVHRNPTKKGYRKKEIFHAGASISPAEAPHASLDLAKLFAG